MTNHEMFVKSMEGHRGETLTTAQVKAIVKGGFPGFNEGSLLPNDHGSGNKSCCWCAGTESQIFEQIRFGVYRVLSSYSENMGGLGETRVRDSMRNHLPPISDYHRSIARSTTPDVPKSGEAHVLADSCKVQLPLKKGVLGNEYFYQSLPQCVIDAVYSIGVKYKAVQNTVARYSDHFGFQEFRQARDRMPPTNEQVPLSTLVEKMSELGIERFTRDIFRNRQRTSPTNGILKSEAVFRFSKVLCEHEIEFLQDVSARIFDRELESKLMALPGQASGLSISYFFMLTGADEFIKPDRWVIRFLSRVLRREVGIGEAQTLLSDVCKILRPTHPNLTPRLLDHLIWSNERIGDKEL
jgi:hypothetical protein